MLNLHTNCVNQLDYYFSLACFGMLRVAVVPFDTLYTVIGASFNLSFSMISSFKFFSHNFILSRILLIVLNLPKFFKFFKFRQFRLNT